MFGAGQLGARLFQYAPRLLMTQFSSLLLGMAAGYCILLLLFGPLSLVSGLLQVLLTAAIAKGLAIGAHVGIAKGIALFEGHVGGGSGAGRQGHLRHHTCNNVAPGGGGRNVKGSYDFAGAMDDAAVTELD
ncbi:hypothetical protein TraAM80_00388 [Trypanosoma rangeli]|uniref:Uncharacterized protein n=1 Tax=Trypanosoma rangeli TaxID=5698 RepID=A0A422P3S3_TRYRA|nr:uncharacterized protein TraAM80_00388 [Trypanosoma rangeli]RNF12376.1 hypothetical protein TraAM80_00388 [Trypanosoma rangeli]|eukprot:RNF12376.1 hypothetical protein TraAM80_00388 [Trypanosoma rangeli]